MSWQKRARIGLAVTGLAVAAAIVYYSRQGSPPPQPQPAIPPINPELASAGSGGNEIRTKDGKPLFAVTYATRENFTDGRGRYTKAIVTGLDENKSRMRADVVEILGTDATGVMPLQIRFTGHVVVEEEGGLAIETETGTYDDATGVVTIPGNVTFRRGRTSGSGVGATYDRKKGIIVIQDQATARVTADANGTGAAEAFSKRMIMERGQHSLRLEENARIVSATQTLTAATAAMLFTEDETALKFLELRGTARVDPLSGSPANQPAMNADNISMAFHPDGQTLQNATLTGQAALTLRDQTATRSIKASWIYLVTAKDGRTLTTLNAKDRVIVDTPANASTPARRITAQSLTGTGEEKKGLTSARFEGNPEFEETGSRGRGAPPQAVNRTGKSTVLVLTLGGQLDAIEEARFDQSASFVSDRLTATSDVAIYREAKGVLELRRNAKGPQRRSTVTSPEFFVESNDIDLFLESENLLATGDVKSRFARKDPKKHKTAGGGLFSGSDPITGTAATLNYRKDSGTATYTGTPKTLAMLEQRDTRILANELVFEEAINRLRGTGKVDSTTPMTVTDDKGRSQVKEQKILADTMTYDDATRRAVYEGQPVTLTSPDGTTEGQTMTFELADDGKTLKRLLVRGDVFATRTDGHEFSGIDLEYRMEDDLYILKGNSGNPAVVKQPPSDPKAPNKMCDFTAGQRLEFARRTGAFQSQGSMFKTEPRSCAESLRKSR